MVVEVGKCPTPYKKGGEIFQGDCPGRGNMSIVQEDCEGEGAS